MSGETLEDIEVTDPIILRGSAVNFKNVTFLAGLVGDIKDSPQKYTEEEHLAVNSIKVSITNHTKVVVVTSNNKEYLAIVHQPDDVELVKVCSSKIVPKDTPTSMLNLKRGIIILQDHSLTEGNLSVLADYVRFHDPEPEPKAIGWQEALEMVGIEAAVIGNLPVTDQVGLQNTKGYQFNQLLEECFGQDEQQVSLKKKQYSKPLIHTTQKAVYLDDSAAIEGPTPDTAPVASPDEGEESESRVEPREGEGSGASSQQALVRYVGPQIEVLRQELLPNFRSFREITSSGCLDDGEEQEEEHVLRADVPSVDRPSTSVQAAENPEELLRQHVEDIYLMRIFLKTEEDHINAEIKKLLRRKETIQSRFESIDLEMADAKKLMQRNEKQDELASLFSMLNVSASPTATQQEVGAPGGGAPDIVASTSGVEAISSEDIAEDLQTSTPNDMDAAPQPTADAGPSTISPGATSPAPASEEQELGAPGGGAPDGAEATPSNVPTALGEGGGAVAEGASSGAVVQEEAPKPWSGVEASEDIAHDLQTIPRSTSNNMDAAPQPTADAGPSTISPGATPPTPASEEQELGAPGGGAPDGEEATPSNVPTALGEGGGAVAEGASSGAVVQEEAHKPWRCLLTLPFVEDSPVYHPWSPPTIAVDFEGATEEDRTTEPQHTAAAGHSNNIVPGVTPAPTAAHQQEMGAPGGDGAEATPSNVPTALGEEGGAVEEGAGGAAVVQPVSRPLRQTRQKRKGGTVPAGVTKRKCLQPSIDPTYSGVLTRSMTKAREDLQTMVLRSGRKRPTPAVAYSHDHHDSTSKRRRI